MSLLLLGSSETDHFLSSLVLTQGISFIANRRLSSLLTLSHMLAYIPKPDPAGNLVAEALIADAIDLTWDAVVGATTYSVERKPHLYFPASYTQDVYNTASTLVVGLAPRTMLGVTVSGTGIDLLADTGMNGFCIQSVGSGSGTGWSLAGKVQESDDNSIWTDLVAFTAVTSSDKVQVISFTRTKRYIRWQGTVTGGSPSVVVEAVFGATYTGNITNTVVTGGVTPRTISTNLSSAATNVGIGNSVSVIQSIGAVSGTLPTLAGKIQESNDGITSWTNVSGATFTTVNSANNLQKITFTTTKQYVRYVATVTGVTPSFAITAPFIYVYPAYAAVASPATNSYTDSVATGVYDYRVRPSNGSVYGGYSNEVFGLSGPSPTDFVGVLNGDNFDMTWDMTNVPVAPIPWNIVLEVDSGGGYNIEFDSLPGDISSDYSYSEFGNINNYKLSYREPLTGLLAAPAQIIRFIIFSSSGSFVTAGKTISLIQCVGSGAVADELIGGGGGAYAHKVSPAGITDPVHVVVNGTKSAVLNDLDSVTYVSAASAIADVGGLAASSVGDVVFSGGAGGTEAGGTAGNSGGNGEDNVADGTGIGDGGSPPSNPGHVGRVTIFL